MTAEKSPINAHYRRSCDVVFYKLHNANKVSEKRCFGQGRVFDLALPNAIILINVRTRFLKDHNMVVDAG